MNTTHLNPYDVASSFPQVCHTIPEVFQRMRAVGIGEKEILWTERWIDCLKRFCKGHGCARISRQSGLDFLADMRVWVAPDDSKGLWRIEQATRALKWLFVLTGKSRGAGSELVRTGQRGVGPVANRPRQITAQRPVTSAQSPVEKRPLEAAVSVPVPAVAVCLDAKEPTRGWGRARVEVDAVAVAEVGPEADRNRLGGGAVATVGSASQLLPGSALGVERRESQEPQKGAGAGLSAAVEAEMKAKFERFLVRGNLGAVLKYLGQSACSFAHHRCWISLKESTLIAQAA